MCVMLYPYCLWSFALAIVRLFMALSVTVLGGCLSLENDGFGAVGCQLSLSAFWFDRNEVQAIIRLLQCMS